MIWLFDRASSPTACVRYHGLRDEAEFCAACDLCLLRLAFSKAKWRTPQSAPILTHCSRTRLEPILLLSRWHTRAEPRLTRSPRSRPGRLWPSWKHLQ